MSDFVKWIFIVAALTGVRSGALGRAVLDLTAKNGYEISDVRVVNLLVCDYVSYTEHDTRGVTRRVAPHLVQQNKWTLFMRPILVVR